jgi:hypothetical protein
MGKRYTKEEISRIQTLTQQGLTSNEIAIQLGRPEAGIRNIRYRMKMKTNTKETLTQLTKEHRELKEKINQLRLDTYTLNTRKKELQQAIQVNEQTLNKRLQTTLNKLKDQRPNLFEISLEEQIAKLSIEIAGSFLRYLLE